MVSRTHPAQERSADHMTKRESSIDAYRRLSDKDRRVFHRWIIGNIVVGAISVIGLIAITSVYTGRDGSVPADVYAQER